MVGMREQHPLTHTRVGFIFKHKIIFSEYTIQFPIDYEKNRMVVSLVYIRIHNNCSETRSKHEN